MKRTRKLLERYGELKDFWFETEIDVYTRYETDPEDTYYEDTTTIFWKPTNMLKHGFENWWGELDIHFPIEYRFTDEERTIKIDEDMLDIEEADDGEGFWPMYLTVTLNKDGDVEEAVLTFSFVITSQ